jgi:hypothetical protein
LRKLGIPTVADRVVQAALKLVLEPIFEADFVPVSYGFRPMRRAHDAIAEIHQYGTQGYRWVLDADIEACFDSIDHAALMDRVRIRVKDKRVLLLVKAFLKAGVLTELGENKDTNTGTPQGGILSPLLANIALSVLDEHLHEPWRPGGAMSTAYLRSRRRVHGQPRWRVVRYADDFVVLVHGQQAHVEALREDVAEVAPTSRTAAFGVQNPGGAHERRVRLSWLPHPVEAQKRHEHLARLYLHCRPAHPVVEGQDPCPDVQEVAARSRNRADQAQPDHARVGQLFPACRLQTHTEQPVPLCMVAGDAVAA